MPLAPNSAPLEGNRPATRSRPELIAPAGDALCLRAAVENGADAVYFGLTSHNARARATNFEVDSLPQTFAYLRRHGVKGYVTLNTLLFTRELETAESLIRAIAQAGADAVIVQDLGLCQLIRAVAPHLPIHASTQMTITSVAGIELAEELGISRVILARELSLDEIAQIRRQTTMPLEVFVHGALCVAYSGQCLTSEALGARSANRGQCAQACRMPYTLICDGRPVDLDNVQYLLSPQDLAAIDLIPRLVELGIASLKIEGRLKAPEYVASVTRHYRDALDQALAGGAPFHVSQTALDEMALTFSRGFSHGFLDGTNHKALVRGDYAKKRGLRLGQVVAVHGRRIRVRLDGPLKPGDGIVFAEEPDRQLPEQGGRVYTLEPAGPARLFDLELGRRDIDPHQIAPGQQIWKSDDPELTARIRQTFQHPDSQRTVALHLIVTAATGQPLRLEAATETGFRASIDSSEPLPPARTHPATPEALRSQCQRLGGTPFHLGRFEARIEGQPLVPHSLLNQLRRDLVAQLLAQIDSPTPSPLSPDPVLPRLRAQHRHCPPHEPNTATPSGSCTHPTPDAANSIPPPELIALCRDLNQAEAAVATGLRTVYLDFHHVKLYRQAVERLRHCKPDLQIFLAPPRVEKPGEAGLFRLLAKAGADGLLVRNAGGLRFCQTHDLRFVTDYSLNAANDLTVAWLKSRGAERITASHDLSFEQLDDLLTAVDPAWLEIVVHHHMPMFHMEHCVFCAFLSPGTDKTNCGRPCDHHQVALRDRVGVEHPLQADIGCRNTLYNAVAQSAAEYLPRLLARGVRALRIEFLAESPTATATTLGLYADALAGRRDPRALWRQLRATSHYGITRGQLPILD
ncbi:MAG: peptidase U32 [Isosphaeraceae bacterium]|nr:MAG: peptidase U32 [Isosphaeraceae bacterium]